jgi:hypothetical protein
MNMITTDPGMWRWLTGEDETTPIQESARVLLSIVTQSNDRDFWESSNSRYLQIVFPTLQRLRAALIPLRIGKDPIIAESARKLGMAAESWGEKSRDNRRKYKRAHQGWAQAYKDFRTAAFATLKK